MITLYGFTLSNYYNKVKLALLEKGVPFEEHKIHPRHLDDALRAASPLGKVPFIRTAQGTLCESQVILEWLEETHPTPALLPADPFERAKVRELATFIDLHLELVARELYGRAFFGGEISEANAARIRKLLDKNIAGFKSLAKFAPFVAGERFTLADCSAWVSLPLVSMATRIVYDEDLLASHGIDWKSYGRRVGERPAAQRVTADRKADEAAAQAAAAAKKD
jgi:glutathione S-transferase